MWSWLIQNEDVQILFRAIVALLLGGAIGWERETAGKWAGFRTHMLVCLSSMLFVDLGLLLIHYTQTGLDTMTLRTDPVRIIQSIVTGIAFLGAGTIFHDQSHRKARGLTTAASLLVTAPIGIAVAIDRYILAIGVTVIVLFVLRIMNRWENKVQD